MGSTVRERERERERQDEERFFWGNGDYIVRVIDRAGSLSNQAGSLILLLLHLFVVFSIICLEYV